MSTMQPAPVADQPAEELLPPVPAEPAAEEVPEQPLGASPVAATGPIPGLPELPPPPPPAGPQATPAGSRRRLAPPVHLHAGVAGPALAVLAVLLLELGLLVHEGGRTLWARTPLWAAFATVAAVVGLVAFAGRLPGLRRLGVQRPWGVAAGGLCGLAVFWLLVALPSADTDRGFLLTAALACLGAALWTAPGRGSAVAPARGTGATPATAEFPAPHGEDTTAG